MSSVKNKFSGSLPLPELGWSGCCDEGKSVGLPFKYFFFFFFLINFFVKFNAVHFLPNTLDCISATY